MNVNSILILIRTESDFERVVAIAIANKDKYKQDFIFVGDFSPFYNEGIKNNFQKALFNKHGFIIHDFSEFDFMGGIFRKICKQKSYSLVKLRENKIYIFRYLIYKIFTRYIISRKHRIIQNIFKITNSSILLTDQSCENDNYLPEQIRKVAIARNISVYMFAHGAAGGLHSEFSEPEFQLYKDYTVFVCNKNETNIKLKNRIILGDVSSSFPYVKYINSIEFNDIEFFNDRKYKIAFLVPGTGPYTSTTGWFIQEEIIINLSENTNVAMVLKLHPREASFIDLRMLERFKNLLIVSNETDRSRVTKWADIVVCGDHCSTIFEPMILGKKVVAVEGKHLPKYQNNHSPIKHSSVMHISNSNEFCLDKIPYANPKDPITNEIAWGGNGDVDLAQLLFKIIV